MDVPATRVRLGLKKIAAPPKRTESTQTRPARPVIAEKKARQSAKIRELGQVLIDVGLRSLDDQANALGVPRSTAWTILKTCHKSYGLSAAVIERMLRSSKLPPRAARSWWNTSRKSPSVSMVGAGDNNSDLPFACPTPSQAGRAPMKRNGEGAKKCLGGARSFLGQCVRARWRMRTGRASASIDS